MTEFRTAFLDFGFRRIGAFITDRAIAVRLEDGMDAKAFRAAWVLGNGGPAPKAAGMDTILHAERLLRREKRLYHPAYRA